MEYQEICYEKREQVAWITLSRPDHLNAFTVRMARELIDAFDLVDVDDEVRAVVVTGAGRAFCAGADLAAGGASFDLSSVVERHTDGVVADGSSTNGWGFVGDGEQRAPADLGGVVVLRIHRCVKPIIAAINGPAVGVGLTMTLPMDIRLVAEGAKLGFVFNRRGISIDGAASWFLPRIVGVARALEWIDTGRVFTPDDALSGGLVSKVYPDTGSLHSAAADLASEIADNCAPVSVAVSRRLLWDALGDESPEAAHQRESVALFRRGRSADARAGVEAFLDKRSPEFVDRVSDSEEILDPPR